MPNQTNNANLIQMLRRIPPKWALAVVGVVLIYWLSQPVLNRSLGWNLPSIAKMLGEPERPVDLKVEKQPEIAKQYEEKPSPVPKVAASKPKVDVSPPLKSAKKPAIKPSAKETDYLDFLTEVARDRYQSPAGLFYTRGSEEGHRLKHLAKHLEDEPTRPGSHGVFNGDLLQALRWIDDAYQTAKKGDRNARTRKEGDSTIYEVTFDKPIGYVGGSDGKRKGNPSTKRVRIVVIGQNVITAFPF